MKFLLKIVQGEALLDDEGAGEVEGLRAHAGEVVDRAADGELADVAAGEAVGRDNEAVGGHGDFFGGEGEHGSVVRRKLWICKMLLKNTVNQLAGLAAAGAVRQGNFLVGHFLLLVKNIDAVALLFTPEPDTRCLARVSDINQPVYEP